MRPPEKVVSAHVDAPGHESELKPDTCIFWHAPFLQYSCLPVKDSWWHASVPSHVSTFCGVNWRMRLHALAPTHVRLHTSSRPATHGNRRFVHALDPLHSSVSAPHAKSMSVHALLPEHARLQVRFAPPSEPGAGVTCTFASRHRSPWPLPEHATSTTVVPSIAPLPTAFTTMPWHVWSPVPRHATDRSGAGPGRLASTVIERQRLFGSPLRAWQHVPPMVGHAPALELPVHVTSHAPPPAAPGQRMAASLPTLSPCLAQEPRHERWT